MNSRVMTLAEQLGNHYGNSLCERISYPRRETPPREKNILKAASRGGRTALPRTGTNSLTMFALPNFMSWRSDQRERVHELARERHSLPVVPAPSPPFQKLFNTQKGFYALHDLENPDFLPFGKPSGM